MFASSWLLELQRRVLGRRIVERKPARRRMHLTLENLEDRAMPSVVTISVTSASDTPTYPATETFSQLQQANLVNVTLRDALDVANNSGIVNTYVINLQSSTAYHLTQIDNYWYGPDGLPAIANNVTINGNGATIERDSSAPNFRLFYVSGGFGGLETGSLTLNNLTLEGGMAQGGSSGRGGGGLGAGGAIFSQGTVILTGVTLASNQAVGGSTYSGFSYENGGGGMGQDAQRNNGGGFGGPLIGGNFGGAGGRGGSAGVKYFLDDFTLVADYYSGGGGGGGGFLSISDGQAGNKTTGGMGGGTGGFGGAGGAGLSSKYEPYFNVSGGSGGDGGGGGGGLNIGGNTNSNGAPGGAFGSGGLGNGGGGGIGGGGGSAGYASGGGGGFGGGGGAGGALASGGNGGFGGGGGEDGGNGGFGGGGGGGGGAGMGGAIFNMLGSVTVTNSTLADNSALGGSGGNNGSGMGGAVFNVDGSINITFSTLADNIVSSAGGALYNLAYGNTLAFSDATTAMATINNSILSGSIGGVDLVNNLVNGANINTATVKFVDNNVVQTSAGALSGTTPLAGDPELSPLHNNGGLTETLAITSSASSAYRKGTAIAGITTDQRGYARSTTTAPTLGAFDPEAKTADPTAPILSVSAPSGPFTDFPFPATGTAVNASNTPVVGTFTYAYYVGSSATGTPTATAPTNAGTYTVVATFSTFDPNYLTGGTAQTTFTITPATLDPTLTVSDAGGVYNLSRFPATGKAVGVHGETVAGSFTFAYYVGSSASGTPSATAPINVDTYTVVATFASKNAIYNSGGAAQTTFTITPALPTVIVTDAGGPATGASYPASAAAVGLDGVTPVTGSFTFAYYLGASAIGAPSATAPSIIGNYTVVATLTSANPNYAGNIGQTTFYITGAAAIPVNSSSSTPTYAATVEYAQLLKANFKNVTLLDALHAETNSGSGASSSFVVNLQANTTYDLTQIDNYWFGPDGLPAISTTVTIEGNGSTIERDSGAPDFRLFYVSGGMSGLGAGNLTLDNLTLQGGLAVGGSVSSGGLGAGGAIFNQGILSLDGVTLAENTAQGGNAEFGGSGGGMGGGASAGFGGNFPSDTYGGEGEPGGAASGGAGGGFEANGPGGGAGATSNGRPNSADHGSGGDFGFGGSFDGGGGGVGGGGGAGGDGQIQGGVLIVDPGDGGDGGFGGGGGSAGDALNSDMQGDTFGFAGNGGFGGGGGGGGGSGGFGGGNGGIDSGYYISVPFQGGAFGTAPGSGGGGGGFGGAIFSMGGAVTVTNSTLHGNTAQGGSSPIPAIGFGGSGGSGFGGAIFNLDGTLNVTFTTIADNTVAAGTGSSNGQADGGAVYNMADDVGLGVVTAATTITDSILSGSTGGNDLANNSGAATLVDKNIVQTHAGTLAGTTPITTDPNLGQLQDNGGPTETMAITSISPAYRKGTAIAGITTDQRGDTRSTSTAPSLGAYDPDALLAPTVTVTDAGGIYRGTGFAAVGKAVGSDGTTPVTGVFTYSYYVGNTATGTPSTTAPANAGTYTVVATFASSDSTYGNGTGQTTFTIGKADATVNVTPYTVTYNGAAHSATVTTITGVDGQTGATVGAATLSSTHTNAGTFASDTWSFTGTANYNDIASTTITDTINKADATVVVTPYTVTYDGLSHVATAASINGVDGQTGATVGTVILGTTHTAAGTYASDTWSFTGTANYNSIASTTITDTINKADATVVITPYTVTYDGLAHTATVTSITGVDGQTGATVGVVTLTTTHTAAGTYAGDTWSFTGKANYNSIASTTITDTINKADATVVVTPYTVTYDGIAHTATVTITGVDGQAGATVGTVDVSSTTHTNAGTYAIDTWTFTGKANYNSIASTTITDTINKADATVVVTPYDVTYNGFSHAATITSITGVHGQTGATVGTVTRNTTHTNAAVFATDSWSFTGTANYNDIASTIITDTINKADATVVVAPYAVTYDGMVHTATVTSITGVNGQTGATVGTVDLSNTTHTVAGTYAGDSWSFTGTRNYNGIASSSITDTINKADATVVVAPYTVTYDGTLHSATATSITGVNGESGAMVGVVDVSGTTHTAAGTYASDSWSFSGPNYNSIASTTITDTINKADATVVVTPYTVTYDGTPHTAGVTSITGVNGETGATVGVVDVSGTTHTAAGTYTSDSWSFTGAANYNNIASTSITDTINKADATVVVTPYTVIYDGNSHTAAVTSITGVNGETGATVGLVDASNTTHTAAGTYASDSWSFTGTSNYNNIASTSITDTIIPSTPIVTNPTAINVTSTIATLGGAVSSNGSALIKSGILYAPTSLGASLVIGGQGVTEVDAASAAAGVFTENLTGLSPNTAYSFVAFATNSQGAGYSPIGNFSTTILGPLSAITGPASGQTGQTLTFVLDGYDPISGMQLGKFAFHIKWGDGSTGVVTGLNGSTVTHTYASPGSYVIQISATDARGSTLPTGTSTVAISSTSTPNANLAGGNTGGTNTPAVGISSLAAVANDASSKSLPASPAAFNSTSSQSAVALPSAGVPAQAADAAAATSASWASAVTAWFSANETANQSLDGQDAGIPNYASAFETDLSGN